MRSLFLLLFALSNFSSFGQTCCSGGVPVSSNLGLPASESQVLQFNLSYDLNVLKTLKSGADKLDDRSRDRKTHSVLLELGYSLTSRISVDAFFSLVRQERTITNFGQEDFTYSQGIGDAVLLFKYKVLTRHRDQTTLTAALGVKAPTGAADKLDPERGISLNADLQPGSGAWDGIGWAQFSHVTAFRPSLSLISTMIYSIKGKNTNYFDTQEYQFGQELQISAGLSDRIILGKQLIDPALLVRYRTVRPDKIDGQNLPSTGGDWIFINPSLSFWLKPDLSFNINGELPLYAFLEGTQVTPTYRINLGLYYRMALAETDAPPLDPFN